MSPEDAIEAEWYNGNIGADARDRLLAVARAEPGASPPEGTKLVLMSDDLMDVLATGEGKRVTWEWGEPDDHGWYAPTFTEHASEPGASEGLLAAVVAFLERWDKPATFPDREALVVPYVRDLRAALEGDKG